MKTFTLVAFAVLGVALARPAVKRLSGDTANGMQDVISGSACKDVAVIFARGTFDSGNIGVWVGPQFQAALQSQIGSLAFQGVDSNAYPATLSSYLAEGGSDAGSQSLADTVTDYVNACPSSKVVVTGWSQGALVAHKGLNLIPANIQSHVVGFVTFGDPNRLFTNAAVPASIAVHSECFTGTLLDPLCASLSSDFKWPTSISDITGPFEDLPSLATGASEVASAAELVVDFPGQLWDARHAFEDALTDTSKMQRLLLSPQHFMYGNNGQTTTAANFVAGLV
ncbi:carbohydrate esterase family 5 protein [Roridomyces roridus]|uniref:cutinase n=1 Tax=Roridomyces roridus TaxID=1738132 RepID=A0AAD7CCH1_9AGAR|nr:carbohydrate esterase family 5 protein [Roridomyces roridus]